MKTCLAVLNSKFMHTSLALRDIRAYARKKNIPLELAEYTINAESDNIVASLAEKQADLYGFSCYVFNIDKTMAVIRSLQDAMSTISFDSPVCILTRWRPSTR